MGTKPATKHRSNCLITSEELDLTHSLTPGQSFTWKVDSRGKWTGVVRGRVVRVRRDGENILAEGVPCLDESFIQNYFRTDVCLSDLYCDFIAADPRIERPIEHLKGLRVLRQDPEETLLSYICSTANSVPRISAAIESMSRKYGEHIAEFDGHHHYSLPTAEALANADPDSLSKECGLGFRGRNLNCVARQLVDRGPGWLDSLRQATYEEARAELLQLRCVGMKIADCVLLFSLDKDQAFPVDTHIRAVAVRHYLPEFRQKTLTCRVYQEIAEFFRNKFGRYAGWAQEYLFYDDLLRHPPSERVL